MDNPLVAVVTGANRGIGHAICTSLVQNASKPLVLYAASRTGAPIDLDGIKSTTQVRWAKLSLTDHASMVSLTSTIRKEHGWCDVLINNAGVYYFKENITAAQRKETLNVNYRGTLKMCQEFIPLMRMNGRVVNLSSQSGQLKYFHPHLRQRFLDPDLNLDELESLIQEYSQAAQHGEATASGWPSMTYFTSKAAMNAATRILARDNPRISINCCCPGWVATPLGAQAGQPPKTLQEGAKIPLRLGFGDIGNVTGRYWANDSVAQTGDGKVQVCPLPLLSEKGAYIFIGESGRMNLMERNLKRGRCFYEDGRSM